MSSDFFAFENCVFSDQFSPFAELHPLPEQIYENDRPVDFTSSSHGVELANLSLSQLRNAAGEMKMEEFHLNFNDEFSGLGILPQVLDETAPKLIQRSNCSNSFESNRSLPLRSRFDCVSPAQNLHNHQIQASSEGSSFSSGFRIRKVCSTGDLQLQNETPNSRSTNSLTTSMEAAKPYSAEERKQRIHRYRAKKTQRNFNKKIKYVCRKTLADNRPRIRGRFAPHDDKASQLIFTYDDQIGSDLFWVDQHQMVFQI